MKYYGLACLILIVILLVYNNFRISTLLEEERLHNSCTKLYEPQKVKVSKKKIITCFRIGLKNVCVEESPPPASNSGIIWSEFIGIGPARSGSSNLLWTLMAHPQVQVGDPQLQNQSCCPGSELSFFSNDEIFKQGIEYYKGYFAPRKPEIKIAGEKTPTYSDHPMVPYRIRALLGPHVKLLFTLRDPMEALLSLYSLRHQDARISVSEWFTALLEDQIMYEECVQNQMKKIRRIGGQSPFQLHETLGQMDLYSARMLDESAAVCWSRPTDMRGQHERLQHYIYKENLMRWHAVFPNQVLCIWSDEFRSQGKKTINAVLRFLGLNPMPSAFKPKNFASEKEKKLRWKRELGPLHRKICDFLLERNRGLEKICPRMWSDRKNWCSDKSLVVKQEHR